MTALAVAEPAAGVLDQASLHLVDSMTALDECRRWLGERRDGPLCVDTESGGLDVYRHRHRLTQLGDKYHGWAFGPAWFGAANEMIRAYPWLAMHNQSYDWRVFRRHQCLEPRWAVTENTLTLARLADSLKPAGLKPRAALDVDPRAMAADQQLEAAMKRQRWTWDTVPPDFAPYWMYGAMDTVLTAWMFDRYAPVKAALPQVYDLERAVDRICAGMMDAGMMIDVPFIEAKTAAVRAELAQIMPWLRAEHGITSARSSEQVAAAMRAAGVELTEITDGGAPSFTKGALDMYAIRHPQAAWLCQAIRKARKAEDIAGKYLGKFLELADADGIVHYSINTMRADTHRQSITDPPMQTFDRDEPAIRGSFIPRPGHVFITIDADQIEARLAAIFSGDRRMIADFNRCDAEGLNFFVEMTSQIYGEPVSKKDPRYSYTKNGTYAQIYGSGLATAARTFGVPEENLKPSYDGFRQLYPGVHRLMKRTINEARAMPRPGVRTLMGRMLYCRRGYEYVLQDYRIQGSAAEIFKMGMVKLDAAGYGGMLRLPMHDEYILEVPKEHAQEILRGITEVLTDRESFSLPITWGGSILPERWEKR